MFEIEETTDSNFEPITLTITKMIDGKPKKNTTLTFKFSQYDGVISFITDCLDSTTEPVKYEIY
jgi:hypothetical protein